MISIFHVFELNPESLKMQLFKFEMKNCPSHALKGYCTVFQHALKLLKITGIVLT